MIAAWTPTDVYAAEAAVMAELAPGDLMARAVEALAAVATARLKAGRGQRVVALVGPGNNGADALFAAGALAVQGYSCAAVHLADRVHAGALAAATAAGVVLVTGEAEATIAEADLVLDGIVGLGGRAGLPDFAAPWVAAIPDGAYVLAVDLPSGQDPMGGELDPDGVFADETVTFSVLKPVHLLPPTEAACGLLTVMDIGLELPGEPAVRRLTRDDVASLWPAPTARDDKYSRGVVGIVAGGEHYTGAAVLAATAAAEAGAGMVRYVGPPTPTALVRAAVPEAVMGEGRVQAWVVGPGLDVVDPASAEQVAIARSALAGASPVLVDAGGLDLLDGPCAAPLLLTPHAGEAARLLSRMGWPVAREEVLASPVRYAARLAAAMGATVLLKGATTVIAEPDGALWSQADAPPWLATAGAGDVLAGLLGTLLAAGVEAPLAAALGALVHGVAADRVNPGGPVRALTVARGLPGTIAHLL